MEKKRWKFTNEEQRIIQKNARSCPGVAGINTDSWLGQIAYHALVRLLGFDDRVDYVGAIGQRNDYQANVVDAILDEQRRRCMFAHTVSQLT